MKRYFFSIIFVHILTIFVNQIFFINAIRITNTSIARFSIKTNVSNLSLLLNATSSLCIVFGSEEIFNDLFELFKHDYKPVTLYDYTKPLLTCVGVFILEANNHTVLDCEGILDSYQTTVVHVIKDSITAAFSRSLEACLSVTQSPEVLALSLSNGSLLQLSPVLPQPRHFVSTSVTEVLQLREDKWKKLDLQGSALNIGTLYYVPFFFYMHNKPPASSDEYDGIYLQLVKEMARRFNFTCRYLVYKGYGIALDNGTWTGGGLSQVIQEGKIDIVAVNMWQVPEFYNQVDFGPALNKAKMAFLVFRPELIDFQWQAVLRIFKPKVWFSILGSFVLTVVVYWAGVNWDPHPRTESWSGCILTMFGYFTSASTHSRVDEGNTRFALTSWAVFSLLITTSLSTGIVTRLTVPSYSPRIDTVEQLVEGDYFWTVQFYADFINNTLLRHTVFDFQNHWIQQFEGKYVYIDEDEVARTAGKNKKMTYLSQIYGNDFVVLEAEGLDGHEALNKYRVTKESTTEAHVTFGVKKRSFLFEPLMEFSLLIVQAGLMTRWRDEVIRRWPQYDTRHLLIEQDVLTFREPQGLPLHKVQPVFLLLLLGLSLAFVVFFIEICW